MSSNIPKASDQPVSAIVSELNGALRLMTRKSRAQGKPQSARRSYMTLSMMAKLRQYKAEFPKAPPGQIARRFGTDPERTREVLRQQ